MEPDMVSDGPLIPEARRWEISSIDGFFLREVGGCGTEFQAKPWEFCPRTWPASASQALSPEMATSTLGEVLGVAGATEDELYGTTDALLARQKIIEASPLARKHLQDGTLVIYDVSSSYATGEHCDLSRYGHNRDGKKRFPQIVTGLLCASDGCPVAIEVFEGNTTDPFSEPR